MDSKESFSYLDGVPFAIGSKFHPPQSVVLPLGINYELSQELLLQTYDFDVENKVVKEAQMRDECEKIKETEVNNENPETPKNSNVQKTLANHVTSPWNSDSILQPQFQTQNKNLEGATSTVLQDIKQINLSDFENATTSPFDYMELQTINDLEELNTVFQGLCENRRDSVDPNVASESNDPSSSTQSVENQASNVSKSISFPLVQNINFNSSNLYHSEDNTNDAIINKIDENYHSYSSPNMSGTLTGSPTLPPYTSCLKRNSFHGGEFNVSASALSQVPSLEANQNTNYGYTLNYTAAENNIPLRSSKSIPDLSNLNPQEVTYCKTLRSHTPPAKSSEYVPDTSNHKIFVKSSDYSNPIPLTNYVSSNGVSIPHMNLPDPYEELNNSEKEIVDSIYAMGFDRGQVSRTVKHLGTDSKKVVEHLCQIQVLEESGYDKLEAEAALHLHDYNKNEAIIFLDLLNQFQDLGFEKDAIKKALVQNKNDRDKVIDALLSSSS